jgi:hypothetical protein
MGIFNANMRKDSFLFLLIVATLCIQPASPKTSLYWSYRGPSVSLVLVAVSLNQRAKVSFFRISFYPF